MEATRRLMRNPSYDVEFLRAFTVPFKSGTGLCARKDAAASAGSGRRMLFRSRSIADHHPRAADRKPRLDDLSRRRPGPDAGEPGRRFIKRPASRARTAKRGAIGIDRVRDRSNAVVRMGPGGGWKIEGAQPSYRGGGADDT